LATGQQSATIIRVSASRFPEFPSSIADRVCSQASYWFPRHFMDSAWVDHAPFAFWLMDALRPRRVVELGTHNGYSLFVMAEAARRLGLETRITALDSWEGDDQAGRYGEDVYAGVQQVATEYPGMIELIRGYFSDSAARIDDGTVDLIHIDGRHGYEDVREDFELYLPKLSPRGVVIFHDTHEFQEGFGVHRFWDELAATAPSFTFHHGHGLGVLAPNPEAPAAILDFLEAANEEPDAVRAGYERLGAEVALRYGAETSRLQREVDDLRSSTSWRVTAPLRALRDLLP
jgi:hypothetical protein